MIKPFSNLNFLFDYVILATCEHKSTTIINFQTAMNPKSDLQVDAIFWVTTFLTFYIFETLTKPNFYGSNMNDSVI